jgi:tRNA-specific adenosine deaminase 2
MLDTNPAIEAVGGYLREEAIMLLRRFYMSENQNGKLSCQRRFHRSLRY